MYLFLSKCCLIFLSQKHAQVKIISAWKAIITNSNIQSGPINNNNNNL